ncbi:MAG: hypothetical protein KBS68_06445, partial [Clostridiales bacterium]|nr:hypothetical protein [Candidatus Crickella merdequi]
PLKIVFTTILILTILAGILSMYKESKNKLLDRKEYKALSTAMDKAADDFTSNEDLKNYLTAWADENKLDYKVDDAGNIIFAKEASADKTNVNPVVIAVSYNYLTAKADALSLASAQEIAASNMDAGKYTVIFFNNEGAYGNGYKNISSSYFTDDTKLIYLDCGNSAYMSTRSFSYSPNSISIPCEMTPVSCDSAIKIRISGITSGELGSNSGSQPNPVTALGTLLNRMSTKSITYQLADVKVASAGNMYSMGLEATIFLNSYSVPVMTKYIDDRIESYNKTYKDDFPDIEYSYEVVEDLSTLPAYAYSKEASSALNSILYTVKNGSYKFDKNNVPTDHEVDETYAINSIQNIGYENGALNISIATTAYNNAYLKEVMNQNATAASFADANASAQTGTAVPVFTNGRSRLAKDLGFAYVKVNTISSRNIIIKEDTDKVFTPCSYLKQINDSMDIVHLKENEDCASVYTNTLLCFIKDQGNFLSL